MIIDVIRRHRKSMNKASSENCKGSVSLYNIIEKAIEMSYDNCGRINLLITTDAGLKLINQEQKRLGLKEEKTISTMVGETPIVIVPMTSETIYLIDLTTFPRYPEMSSYINIGE